MSAFDNLTPAVQAFGAQEWTWLLEQADAGEPLPFVRTDDPDLINGVALWVNAPAPTRFGLEPGTYQSAFYVGLLRVEDSFSSLVYLRNDGPSA